MGSVRKCLFAVVSHMCQQVRYFCTDLTVLLMCADIKEILPVHVLKIPVSITPRDTVRLKYKPLL